MNDKAINRKGEAVGNHIIFLREYVRIPYLIHRTIGFHNF